jgi:import inner membrane translocase subunit TIM10
MATMCNKKCVTAYSDGELSVGEMSCVDRCVSKYLQAQEKVGAVLQSFEQQMRAQEAAGIGMAQPHPFGPKK